MSVVLLVLVMYRNVVHNMIGRRSSKSNKHQLERIISLEEEAEAEVLLQDLLPSKRVPCGKEKCFYRSRSSSSSSSSSAGANEVGYLVARCNRNYLHDHSRLDRLQAGWELAKRLTERYDIAHFLTSPIQVVTITPDLAYFLNRHLWWESRNEPLTGRKRFPVGSYAFVQTVQVAPQPNILLAVAPSNRIDFDVKIEEFLMQAVEVMTHKTTTASSASTTSTTTSTRISKGKSKSIERRFRKNLKKTRELLRKEPCLIKDFQVLMDTKGIIYHLDFDRCFQPREVDETEECFAYLDEVEIQIDSILRAIEAGSITKETIQEKKEKAAALAAAAAEAETTNSTGADYGDNVKEAQDDKDVLEQKATTMPPSLNATRKAFEQSLESSFQSKNLRKSDKVPCGKEKCFYATKADPGIGFLVARSSNKANRRAKFESLEAGWELAQTLERKYGIKHFLLDQPARVTVSKGLALRLNRNLYSERLQRMARGHRQRYPEGSVAYVQKVKSAPVPNIVIGCAETKQGAFQKEFAPFWALVKRKKTFVRNFERNFANARELLQLESCLQNDFQVLVDSRGEVYHLDFDRCFDPETGKKKPKAVSDLVEAPCVKILDDIVRTINSTAMAVSSTRTTR